MPRDPNVLGRLNQQFSHPAIADIDASIFSSGATLPDAAVALGIVSNAADDPELAYLTAIPAGIQDAVMAVVSRVLQAIGDDRTPVTFSWKASYDWGLEISWGGPCGHVLHLHSRHPGDPLG